MTPMNPLSPEERLALMIATKIGGVTKKELIWIADQIREAVEEGIEAYAERTEGLTMDMEQYLKEREYKKGFFEALHKVIEENGKHHIHHAAKHPCECEIFADRLRSLKVGEGK